MLAHCEQPTLAEKGVMLSKHEHGEFDWNHVYAGDESDYSDPDSELLSIIDALEPGSALDLGCGAGGLVAALATRNWDVTGVDISANALKSAQLILDRQGLNASLVHADSGEWKSPKKFDLVVSSFALPSKRERPATYRTILESCAPNGTILVKEFDDSMDGVMADGLPSLDEFRDAFDSCDILRLERVDTPSHGHGNENHQSETWSAVLLQAVRSD